MMPSFSKGFLRRHASGMALLHRLLDPMLSVLIFYVLARGLQMEWSTVQFLLLPIIFLLVLVVFQRLDLYRSWRSSLPLAESRGVLIAWLIVLCLFIPFYYLEKHSPPSSGHFFLLYALITPAFLILARFGIRFILRQLRKRGKNKRRVVIVGAGNLGEKIAAEILYDVGMGIQLNGFFDDRWSDGLKSVRGVPVLGDLKTVGEYMRLNPVDIIYLALPFRAESKMSEIARAVRDTPTSLYLVPDIFIFSLLNTRMIDFGGIPIFSIFSTPLTGIESWVKRLQDLFLAGFVIAMIFPLLIIIGILIKFTSKGPILFIQKRYGLNGEEVKVYKFRTMSVCEDDPIFTQTKKNDPRVTKLGNFLRRTSLDELPQFFNVLRGELSIVGPRPHPVAMNEHYRHLIDDYMLRHKIKPGITGWAQINGWRGETETLEKIKKRVEFDLEYIRNWSIWFDLKIIVLTIFRGFRGTNAY